MTEKYTVVDLFCGLGGWAKGFLKHGFEVHGYDVVNFSKYYPGVFHQCDLRKYKECKFPDKVDVLVSSSPCEEFTKMILPWKWKFKKIDLQWGIELFNLQYEIKDYLKPKYYVFENVYGATKYVNIPYSFRLGSRYFWTNVPPFQVPMARDLYNKVNQYKHAGIDRPAWRAKIPLRISEAFALRIKNLLSNNNDVFMS